MDALRPTAINIMVELRIERMTAGDGDGGAAMGGRIIKLLAGRTIFGERCFGELQLPKMAGKTVPSRAHRKEKEREERYLCGPLISLDFGWCTSILNSTMRSYHNLDCRRVGSIIINTHLHHTIALA